MCGVGTVAADWAGAVSSPTEGSILWAEPVSPSRLCLPSQVWISSLPTARGWVRAAGPRPPPAASTALSGGSTEPDRLTLDLMLAFLPPLLQLLPVIIQPLQAHDAILKTGSAGTQLP